MYQYFSKGNDMLHQCVQPSQSMALFQNSKSDSRYSGRFNTLTANSWFKISVLIFLLAGAHLPAPAVTLVPEKVVVAIPDQQDPQTPDHIRLTGWIGSRIEANEGNRLVKLDISRLLEGYRKRPGRQTWDGEHIGKWMHAATLAWANTGDPELRKKLDYAAVELVKCQLPDGYLGTYLEKDRWTEWDVWAHKYNLIGLITYMRYTGNMEPLPACRKMADLLCRTFGDEPGQKDINEAGLHLGMAPTSVLEPMVLLYRLTGEKRYLDFCNYIFRSWERPNGAKIISTLLKSKHVAEVGTAKSYEMLSCLNGALEYYRTVGDRKILDACLNAWQDIMDHHLYLTGTASYREHFHADYDLPNVNNVGETCVTVTWLQFNAHLLRLTGEARFAEQLERTILNQLFGAQLCDGSAWGYYVEMAGKKPYSSTLDGHCCLSSGPRGVALIPTFAASTDADGIVVNLYDAGVTKLILHDKTAVTLATETRYPSDGKINITVTPAVEKQFTVKVRVPAWCRNAIVQVDGKTMDAKPAADGYVALNRKWKQDDQIQLQFKLEPRVIVGDHKNEGKVAILYGPLVLTADEALLKTNENSLRNIGVAGTELAALNITPEPAPEKMKSWPGAEVFRINALTRKPGNSAKEAKELQIRLIPFADAGTTGTSYKVWLPYGGSSPNKNLLLNGLESRSRKMNVGGSIIDGSFQSVAATANGKAPTQDWYAVTLEESVTIRRVIFAHGQTSHDGGWFDSGEGKPRIQIKTTADGQWIKVGEFETYPNTTATSSAGLKGEEQFICELKKPVEAIAIRVIGKPACGDDAKQAFSSCAELQAFTE
ncbi:MAG: retaining beta-L-arabinofuranosidase [Pedosphaera sp.]|nr:retaining beta-L-arabinofuranosidase [Pedosphaera sp.]